ncbi:ubiA prenyltransferase domain-containing protein 1-like [Corticium candelabrum]|uniref:ubiA prenyltransferase domain-containing protein 1-like n=1 Tax=Corticium candelabrum TaxID=121492 RepID=UPI002E26F255|nr:ubiA prenyltransferase domain-containing protein 1-like [Corticium candelabrum]
MAGAAVGTQFGDYVSALRPWSFSTSLVPVMLGTALAYRATGVIHIPLLFLTSISVLTVHGAGNLVNTYYDYMKGVDKADNVGIWNRVLVDRKLSPHQVATFGGALYAVGTIMFAMIVSLSSARIDRLALLFFGGLSGSFLYTGGIGLKYYAVGDVVVLLTFGPVSVLFAYTVQTGSLSVAPIFLDIPLALHVEAVLHVKHARDAAFHQKVGLVTLPNVLGRTLSYFYFTLLLFVPYFTFIAFGIYYSRYFWIPAATVLYAFDLEKKFRSEDLTDMPEKTVRLHLPVACLYIVCCLLAGQIPFV